VKKKYSVLPKDKKEWIAFTKRLENIYDNGYRVGPINWNGTTNSGEKLGAGIYVFRFNVKAEDGTLESKAEKLIILR